MTLNVDVLELTESKTLYCDYGEPQTSTAVAGLVELTDEGGTFRALSPFAAESLELSNCPEDGVRTVLLRALRPVVQQCAQSEFWIPTPRGKVRFTYVPLSIQSGLFMQNLQANSSDTDGAEVEATASALFEASPDGILFVSGDGMVERANPTAEQLFGASDFQLVGHCLDSLISAKPSDEDDAAYTNVLQRLVTGERCEWVGHTASNRTTDIEVSLRAVPSLKDTKYVCVIRDITERRLLDELVGQKITETNELNLALQEKELELHAANQQLKELATTDALTGVRNNRAFRERLDHECKRERRYGIHLSLLLMDVDHFKQYNDQFGHPAGDGVLRNVGAILKKCVRNVDDVARYGGEEFVIILPHTPADQARIVAERVRTAIEGGPWTHREVTISIGISTWEPGTETVEQMIARADEALYHSKRTGRNRATHIRDIVEESMAA